MNGRTQRDTPDAKGSRMGAVLYIRVSTDEQARHGVSLDAQEERLRAYCVMRDLTIVGVIRRCAATRETPPLTVMFLP